MCSPSSSPKLFDKSDRTFNIPASLVFQNSDGKRDKHKKAAPSSNDLNASITSNQIQQLTSYKESKETIENSNNIERSSNSALPTTKPPIPAPRAINQQYGISDEERSIDAGK